MFFFKRSLLNLGTAFWSRGGPKNLVTLSPARGCLENISVTQPVAKHLSLFVMRSLVGETYTSEN